MREYVKAMARERIDSIKFLLSSDEAFKPGGSQELTYTEEEVAAIGEQARESGVWLACHAQAAQAVKLAAKQRLPHPLPLQPRGRRGARHARSATR